MFERNQTIAEYSRHLADSEVFTLGQAFSALRLFYSLKCVGCEDDADGLAFLAGVFSDESPNFQIVLSRICDLFSQLTVSIEYKPGVRSRLTPRTTVASTERIESSKFFAAASATRAFWLFKNVKPLKCTITYVDADDRGDEFYARFAEFAAEM